MNSIKLPASCKRVLLIKIGVKNFFSHICGHMRGSKQSGPGCLLVIYQSASAHFHLSHCLFTIDKATLFDPTSTYNCDDKESRANCCDDTTHYPDEHLDLGHSCAFTVIEV